MNNKKEKLDENPVESSNSQMGSDQPLTKSGESSEILFEQSLLSIKYRMEKCLERIEKIEDRLRCERLAKSGSAVMIQKLEDMTDRLEVVEADADSRIYQVDERVEDAQQQIDILIERVNELSLSREEKSHD